MWGRRRAPQGEDKGIGIELIVEQLIEGKEVVRS